jgi:hypothetical protein
MVIHWIARGHECEGSLWDQHLVSLCCLRVDYCAAHDFPSIIGSDAEICVCSNVNHHGIPFWAWYQFPIIPARSEVLPNLVGTVRDRPVFDETGPLIVNPRVLLKTKRGVWDVLPDEWFSLKD